MFQHLILNVYNIIFDISSLERFKVMQVFYTVRILWLKKLEEYATPNLKSKVLG